MNISTLVEHSWKFFSDKLELKLAGGPGLRRSNKEGDSATDTTINFRQNIIYQLDHLPLFPSDVRLIEEYTTDRGKEGNAQTFKIGVEFAIGHKKDWSIGAFFKKWQSNLLGKDIDDNQFTFEIAHLWK